MSVSINKFAADLFKKYEIDRSLFTQDREIRMDDETTIPLERLKIYAWEFKVPLEEMYMK